MVTVGLGIEGGVEALEESIGIDGAGPTSGKVGHDAEDEDAGHKRVGLVAAAPGIDEAEHVGRGVGPAEGAQQAAEVRGVEEGARLPLQPVEIIAFRRWKGLGLID